MMKLLTTTLTGLGLVLAFLLPTQGDARGQADKAPAAATSYRVPYRLTQTNHWLVRVRINGKGPFNFLIDSGAPFLFVGTEAAKATGLEVDDENRYWTPIERLEVEGGAVLKDVKARVEDPFQLVGMNALGLPGATIDGILGYTILARFKLEFDPTRDTMTWTPLDFEPKEPFVPARAKDRKAKLTPELQMMQAMGPLMKVMAVFVGKQPEDRLDPQGRLGIYLEAEGDGVRLKGVLAGSPAARAGLQAGDRLVELAGHKIASLADAHEAVAEVRPGKKVAVKVRRGGETIERSVTAEEGL